VLKVGNKRLPVAGLESQHKPMGMIIQWWRDLRAYVGQAWRAEWLPLSQAEAIGWMLFFAFFLWYAFGKQGGDFLLLDSGNLVVHEGGHALFGYFGEFMKVAGGTILQLLVPRYWHWPSIRAGSRWVMRFS
jgi:hypothetical protein